MTYLTSLTGDLGPLVLDTSVLINLHASRCGVKLLCALSNEIIVPEIVASELEHETSRKNGEHQFVQELATSKNVRLVGLEDSEYDLFQSLICGSPSLDDGEAATIAIAASRKYLPIIDERKGRQQALIHIPDQEPGWSLDLFRHPEATAELGAALSVEAIYLALRDGRMRIHESHCESVVRLIGAQRALQCKSLPGYKTRWHRWHELSELHIQEVPALEQKDQHIK